MPARLSPGRWRVLLPYLDHALELEGTQRDAWLSSLREEDRALAADVAALLDQHARLDAQGYLEAGAAGRVTLPDFGIVEGRRRLDGPDPS